MVLKINEKGNSTHALLKTSQYFALYFSSDYSRCFSIETITKRFRKLDATNIPNYKLTNSLTSRQLNKISLNNKIIQSMAEV